jgi:hypothetical protein
MIDDNNPLGREAKAYYAAALLTGTSPHTPSTATWLVIGDIADLDEAGDGNKVEKTVRGDGVRMTYGVTHIDETIDFKIKAKVGSAALAALEAAWRNTGPIAFMSLTDDKGTAGAQGPVGNYVVAKFAWGKKLKDMQWVDVTLAPNSQMDKFVAV